MMKIHFPEVLIFDGAADNRKMKIKIQRSGNVVLVKILKSVFATLSSTFFLFPSFPKEDFQDFLPPKAFAVLGESRK